MHLLITLLLVLAGIIVLLLLIALFMRKRHYVSREIIIHTNRQKVFNYLKLVRNQESFNKHAMVSPDRQKHTGEQMERLAISMHGVAIKMPVSVKRK